MRSYKRKLVEVEFWDHAVEGKGEKSKDPARFKIWGRFIRTTRKEIIISHWELQTEDKKEQEHNAEIARVLKSAIIAIRLLNE